MKLSLIFFAIAITGVMHAQNIVVTSDSGQKTEVFPHSASVTFIAGTGNHLQDTVRDTAISQGGGRAIATAASSIPVPFAGAIIANLAVGGILKSLHKDKDNSIKGANLAMTQGLSSGTAISKGNLSFTMPDYSMPGTSPVLLRIKPSAKYTARIVRGVQLSAVLTGGLVDTAASKILGIDQDRIPCHLEDRDEGVTLIPDSALESGEYAIVLVPDQEDRMPVSSAILWDFRLY